MEDKIDRWNKTHCDLCGKEVNQGQGIYAIGGFYHKNTCYREKQQSYIDKYDGNDLDSEFESEMVCPYCGYENTDSFEYNDNNEGVRECGRCGSEFEYSVNIEVTYSTKRKTNE